MTTPSRPKSPSAATLGFLTVLDKAKSGFVGGYLLLNAQARPLEFHCTAPVIANRAQQILYGPTLRPYLVGEQIAVALAERVKQKPSLIVTDCEDILTARRLHDTPVLLAHPPESDESSFAARTPARNTFHLNAADGSPATLQSFSVASDYPQDRAAAESFCADHSVKLDWCEPFERIREAISEAQRPAAA